MRHRRTQQFKAMYADLPEEIQHLADRQFALLKENAAHPSLRFKRVGDYWVARVGLSHRALATAPESDVLLWFWIGRHDEYERLIR